MAVLKSLSFTAIPKTVGHPVLNRRDELVERLEDQKSLLNDPPHVRMVHGRGWPRCDYGPRVGPLCHHRCTVGSGSPTPTVRPDRRGFGATWGFFSASGNSGEGARFRK